MSSLLKSTIIYTPSILVPKIFSYLILIIFTRLLTPSEFGLYALVVIYGESLDSVFMNWFRLGILRFLKKNSYTYGNGLIAASIYIYFIILIVGILAIILLTFVNYSDDSILFFSSLTLWFVGNSAMRFGLTILRSRNQQKLYTIFEVLRPTLSFVGIFLLAHFIGFSYISLTFGFFGVTALFGAGVLFWVLKHCFQVSANWQTMYQLIQYASPLVLLFLLSSVIQATDRYMLDSLMGTAIVGVYAASFSLSRPITEIIFTAINLGAFPQLIKLYEQEGDHAAIAHLSKIFSMLLYWGVPVTVGIAALAKPISSLVLGEEYRHTANLLIPLMTLTGLLDGIKRFVFDQVFHLKKASMMHLYTLFPAALLNIILNFILIQSYGAGGAAEATFLSFLLALLLSVHLSRKIFSIPFPVKEACIIFFSSLIMWCCLFNIMRENAMIQLLIAIPLGAAVYFLVSGLLGSEITKKTFQYISSHILSS